MPRLLRTARLRWLLLVPLCEFAAAQSVDTQQLQELSHEVAELRALVRQLQQQVADLSAQRAAQPAPTVVPADTSTNAPAAGSAAATRLPEFGFNALLDGYYEYNRNAPVGRINELRAYDVSSNSFSLNQADIMIERAVDPQTDRRLGLRIDVQFGQATSTLQGNAANELRPEVYRNLFQAYGTYVFPLLSGLTVDFGKWSSSLGLEGNYSKDQLNYSRSFWFDYLPFYHMGIRSKLAVNDKLAVTFWIDNGAQQTEEFNNYKDQLYGLVLTPNSQLTWTFNYYRGQEHPDVRVVNGSVAGAPNSQGYAVMPIIDAPNGHLQLLDSYLSWQVTTSLLLAAEGDYVAERLYAFSPNQRVEGGALYAGYQLSRQFSLAARAEYLADMAGLFSGTTQYLKEGTLTLDYRPMDGFMLRGEWRRDISNQRYFLGHVPGQYESAQPTIGIGAMWWFGAKTGVW